jgi:uncharacterized protein
MPGILCEHCTAACCRYVALPIDTPETFADFEDLRWYLIHEHTSIFVEDGDWYISFQTACRHLQSDHACGIYETRPRICRAYSTEDCDYHSGDYNWAHHFTCAEHLDEYLREHPPAPAKKPRAGQTTRARLRAGAKSRSSRRREADVQRDRRGTPLPPLPT